MFLSYKARTDNFVTRRSTTLLHVILFYMKFKKSVQIYDLQSNCCFTIVTHSLCYGHFSLLLYFFIVDVLIDSVPFLAPVSGPLDGPGSASQDLCHWAVGGDRWPFLCTTRLCDIYICHLFVNTIIHYAAFIILARGCCRQHQIFYRTIQDMLIVVEQANWPFSAWCFLLKCSSIFVTVVIQECPGNRFSPI